MIAICCRSFVVAALLVATSGNLTLQSNAVAEHDAQPSVSVAGSPEAVVCWTRDVDESATAYATWRLPQRLGGSQTPVVVVPVAFHIIHEGDDGNVSDARIAEQIESVNGAFNGTGFLFRLATIDRTDDHTWYRGCFEHESGIKHALATDPAHTLNIYSCDLRVGSSVAGMARYPWNFPEDSFMHGTMVNHLLVVGSTLPNYSTRGFSVVHEIGHYLGLFHTFQGGCAVGDSVEDTPAQAEGIRECRAGVRDSCPAPGVDDTLNFMNWGSDCRDHFTPGQADRMRAIVAEFRPELSSLSSRTGGS